MASTKRGDTHCDRTGCQNDYEPHWVATDGGCDRCACPGFLTAGFPEMRRHKSVAR